MVKLCEYSKQTLFGFVELLCKSVYLLFYDLDFTGFNDASEKLSNCLEFIDAKTIRIGKENCLLVFGYLNIQELENLIQILDSMDIGEFEVSEFDSKQEVINALYQNRNRNNNSSKSIYVNKDERIIQLYNF